MHESTGRWTNSISHLTGCKYTCGCKPTCNCNHPLLSIYTQVIAFCCLQLQDNTDSLAGAKEEELLSVPCMQLRERASTCVNVLAKVNVQPWPGSSAWTHLHLIYILNLQPLGLDKAEQVVPLRFLYAPELILLQQLMGQSAMPSSNNCSLGP